MKIFKSIKWRLQIWYGLILVVVLAGFGFTAYQLERGRQFGRIDNELQRRFGAVANALHRPRRAENPGDFPPDPLPADGLREQNSSRPEFHLPLEVSGLFDANDPDNFYFIINGRDGKEIARSGNVPQSEADFQRSLDEANRDFHGTDNFPVPRASVSFNDNRGIFQRLPSGETILVGCSVTIELRELKITALKLAGVGAIILFFGLAGGWSMVRRAIQPIEEISSTAAKISAGDLSQRINIAETESELGKLAAVLNSTFARLESAFAQQKQFAADAAHELRTPVSVILTQTQTALTRQRDAASYKETVEACQRAAQRMKKLISSLLELARLDAGQEVLKRLRFDFSKTISGCVELIGPLADEHGIKIFTELSPLEIIGDSERLTQVITNLLTNAVQYNCQDGDVHVKLESQNGFAVLTVRDTGAGISAEDLPFIFKRFFRADKSRSSGNAGLGLALARAIVEAHSGTLEVHSEENVGTTFTVRLFA